MSIDKEILLSLIARKLKDEETLWLCRVLIRHDCTANYIFKGNLAERGRIAAHKTLLHTPKHKGLPIGKGSYNPVLRAWMNVFASAF